MSAPSNGLMTLGDGIAISVASKNKPAPKPNPVKVNNPATDKYKAAGFSIVPPSASVSAPPLATLKLSGQCGCAKK